MSAIIPTAERGAAVCGAPEEENPFAAAEYFAGIGLFRMGLEATGWNPPNASTPTPTTETPTSAKRRRRR